MAESEINIINHLIEIEREAENPASETAATE